MTGRLRDGLLAGAGALGVLLPGQPVFAQSDASEYSTADIVVTAQRREQRLQDVPVAVSVVTGAALDNQGIRSVTTLSARLPNVKIASANGTDLLNIRGVGSGNNPGFEQAVGTFVDGIYRGRARATRAALFDIDRIEVLKGPQTTFFGNNTIAGALSITTRKPTDTLSYNASALYTPSIGEYVLEAGVSGPISDTLSARIAGRASGMDGYIYNAYLNDDGPRSRDYQGRISFQFKPTDTFQSDLRFDIGRNRAQNALPYELLNCPPDPAYGPARGACADYLAASGGKVDDKLNYRADLRNTTSAYDFYEIGWTNSLELGDLTLSAISGYFDHDVNLLIQNIPVPTPGVGGVGRLVYRDMEHFHQFSQEVRLQSPTGGTFEWMVGAYYANSKLSHPQEFGAFQADLAAIPVISAFYAPGTPIGISVGLKEKQNTESVFGSATIRPTKGLRVNLGLRYTTVGKQASRLIRYGTASLNPTQEGFTPGSAAAQAALQSVLGGSLAEFPDTDRRDDKLLPSVGLQYDITPDSMAYVSYTKGFKAGGFDNSTTGAIFGPESVDAYEIGIKNTLFERRMTLNLAAFWSDYKDLQENTYVFLPSGLIGSTVGNVAKARSKGLEMSLAWKFNDFLSVHGDVAYLDAKYRDFKIGACTILGSLTPGCVQDMSGKRRGFAPEYSGNFGVTVTAPVSGDLKLTLDPLVYFTSKYFQSASADPLLSQSGYAKVDLRIELAPKNGPWSIALIGQNLTDKATAAYRNPVSTSTGTIYGTTERPRTVSIQASWRY